MQEQDTYPCLRKRSESFSDNWNIENIKDGLQYFFDQNKRYPTVKEVDVFEYLPTSRTIQRYFGGMVELRKVLQLDTPLNHTRGETRSNMARKADNRAREYEEIFYFELIRKIPEVRVHEHKIIRPGDTAADFFIYMTDNDGVVVDLFFAMDMHSLAGIINIKMKKYLDVKHPVYFVLIGNDKILQEEIDKQVGNRKNKLPRHISVVTERRFTEILDSLIT